jgi:hypothetical protein
MQPLQKVRTFSPSTISAKICSPKLKLILPCIEPTHQRSQSIPKCWITQHARYYKNNNCKFLEMPQIWGRHRSCNRTTGVASIPRQLGNPNFVIRVCQGIKTYWWSDTGSWWTSKFNDPVCWPMCEGIDPHSCEGVWSLLGRDWLRKVKLDWSEIWAITKHKESLKTLLSEFEDVFSDQLTVINVCPLVWHRHPLSFREWWTLYCRTFRAQCAISTTSLLLVLPRKTTFGIWGKF